MDNSPLGVDDLQFAYQPGSSTSMCTWATVETINYFLRNDTDVYACLMDMTKAFDLVRHSLQFKKLIAAGLKVIFVRLLLTFTLTNSQMSVGMVHSLIFSLSRTASGKGRFSLGYLTIFTQSTSSPSSEGSCLDADCWVNNVYMGSFGYSDDNLLIAHSLDSLQEMVKTCEEYAI